MAHCCFGCWSATEMICIFCRLSICLCRLIAGVWLLAHDPFFKVVFPGFLIIWLREPGLRGAGLHGFRSHDRSLKWCLYRAQLDGDVMFDLFYLVFGLQVGPVGGAATKIDGEPDGGIRGYAPFFMNDLVDTPGWDFYRTRQFVLADFLWFQILL